MSDRTNPCQTFPIDYTEVLERIGGDRAFLEELLKIYVEECDKKLKVIKEATARQDFPLIQQLGHSLKGSSANLSLIFLQKVSFFLEMAGKEKNIALARSALAALEKEFDNLKDYLRQNPPSPVTP
ncbi:MAG: Hpt domain-containing protein [Clostridiales bacterium]|nr:Hpt domain-containing protein [Clostridiales bacterium]